MIIFGRLFTLIMTAISCLSAALHAQEDSRKTDYRLLLSVAEYPMSYDPLDADIANNADLMKLRYFTPIEIDHEDKFRSSVLKSFEYDNKTFKMTWRVKSDLKYSDGSPIIPGDIVTAIKRMALKRSEFPVLNSVVGIEEWSTKKNAISLDIPGVRLEGDTISISFKQNVTNPFFQFSFSLFAIQPTKCFDLKTSKLICDLPPSSGYYDYSGPAPKLGPNDGKTPPISFALRKGFEKSGEFKMPQRIMLEYYDKNLSDLVKIMDDNSVVRTLDSRLTDEFINQFRTQVDIKRLPKTAIWYLLLDPNTEAFKDKTCRRIFANKYRQLYGDRVSSVKVSTKSFSSPIMPGYLTNEQMDKLVPTPASNSCADTFKKHPIKFKTTYPFWNKLLTDTMVALGMPTSGISKGVNSPGDFYGAFVSNDSSVLTAYVSFWPLDLPSGFNMFFSPNMHPQLVHLLKDRKLSELANMLFNEKNPSVTSSYYEKINVLLYEEAQLNALSYFGNAYVSKGTNVNRLPIATSEPNPWHLFSIN